MFPIHFHCLCLTMLLLTCLVLQHSPLWYPWYQPCFFLVYSLYYSWSLLMSLLDWHWSIATNYPRIKLCNMVSKTLHHLVSISHHPIMQHTKPLQFLLISIGLQWLLVNSPFPFRSHPGDHFLQETLNDLQRSWVAPKPLPHHMLLPSPSLPLFSELLAEKSWGSSICASSIQWVVQRGLASWTEIFCCVHFLFSVPRTVPDTE